MGTRQWLNVSGSEVYFPSIAKTVEQIRKMHQARPFQPFDVYLVDGRSLPVDHPECLAITPAGRAIGIPLADNTIELVGLLLVTTLNPRPNGRSRRGRST